MYKEDDRDAFESMVTLSRTVGEELPALSEVKLEEFRTLIRDEDLVARGLLVETLLATSTRRELDAAVCMVAECVRGSGDREFTLFALDCHIEVCLTLAARAYFDDESRAEMQAKVEMFHSLEGMADALGIGVSELLSEDKAS